jgi:hypothetical protein
MAWNDGKAVAKGGVLNSLIGVADTASEDLGQDLDMPVSKRGLQGSLSNGRSWDRAQQQPDDWEGYVPVQLQVLPGVAARTLEACPSP